MLKHTDFQLLIISGLFCRHDKTFVFFNVKNRQLLCEYLSDLDQTSLMVLQQCFLKLNQI